MLGVALSAALGMLVLAGCGGSSGGSEASTTASAGDSASEGGSTGEAAGGRRSFQISAEAKACLKEKGVEIPTLSGRAGAPPQGGEGGEPPGGFEPPEGGQMPEGGESPGGESSGGVPPTAAGSPGGEGFEEMQKALEECGVETPQFSGGPPAKSGTPTNSGVFRKQVRQYAACVRKNGYELAEPNFSGEGPIFEKSESESAAFKRASAKCQSLLGGPMAGSGSEGENET
jgi:hypothetical protein